jgi:hypothetical protein
MLKKLLGQSNSGGLNVTIPSQIVVYSPAETAEKPMLFSSTFVSSLGWGGTEDQRIHIYIEHRAGKAARLASWWKMTEPGEFCW